MKRKSIKKLIMRQFILYAILLSVCLMVVSSLLTFALDTIATTYDLPIDIEFSDIPGHLQMVTAGVLIGSAFLILCSFFICTRLFGMGISRKIMQPVNRLSKGLSQIAKGDLDSILEFETETEFQEMRDSFNYMAVRLKQSELERIKMEKNRMQLFSNIAHDLKTPMTTITGYAGALESGIVKESEKQREYYGAIKTKSEQVNKLIDQLLTYSKLGTPKYKITRQSTDISELLRVACASMFGEMEQKQMELELIMQDSPVIGMVDPLELNRAVNNLIGNAIHHNPTGTLLKVVLEKSATAFEIRVEDSGDSIPEPLAEELFDPFVSGSVSRGSGTGLGLAIVKKVAEQHGGNAFITESSKPYTKAFVLHIPLSL